MKPICGLFLLAATVFGLACTGLLFWLWLAL